MDIHVELSNAMPEDNFSDDSASVGFETLYPALVEIFGIIAIGYISGRYKMDYNYGFFLYYFCIMIAKYYHI